MKFSCGRTNAQKTKDYKEYLARCKEWHKVFLLWPKTIEEKDGRKICYWLQTVERKMVREARFVHEFVLPAEYEYRVIHK